MGNIHTVGPNEALIVSGTFLGAVFWEFGTILIMGIFVIIYAADDICIPTVNNPMRIVSICLIWKMHWVDKIAQPALVLTTFIFYS